LFAQNAYPTPLSKRFYLAAVLFLLAATATYFAVVSYSLHFEMNRILFPRTSTFSGPIADATVSFKSALGNELLVRRYGRSNIGCIIFFPGQHGATASYKVGNYTSAGLAVFFLAYPGQDGASGRTELQEIEHLVGEAITRVIDECQPSRTVFVGVSLGAVLATYASRSVRPAGLVLSSAAPSLSSAIRVRLRSNPISLPLSWLPLSALLPHDYSIAEGLRHWPDARVVIFQGTDDQQTPIGLLRSSGVVSGGVRLVSVPGGTHSTTFALSREAQLSTALTLIQSDGT
jgi:hypothetical protein